MVVKIPISHTTVIFNEFQGHPNWYENVELCDLSSLQVWKNSASKFPIFLFIQANVT